ncbi:MAG TPA: LysM peptidoglycan-binding domain-containing protein [Mycobacteriales bacterium]|nr:LysM peptidoglycan-binding domain-containing protein [Mycobacteriales bacterium]
MSAMTYSTPRTPAATRAPQLAYRASPRGRRATTAPPVRLTLPASPTRLTRRGRVVVVLVLAALTLLAFSLGRSTTSDASRGKASTPRPTTVVQPGDTLWSIARRVSPDGDPRVTVSRLSSLNDLGGRPIQAGQRLTLPYPG